MWQVVTSVGGVKSVARLTLRPRHVFRVIAPSRKRTIEFNWIFQAYLKLNFIHGRIKRTTHGCTFRSRCGKITNVIQDTVNDKINILGTISWGFEDFDKRVRLLSCIHPCGARALLPNDRVYVYIYKLHSNNYVVERSITISKLGKRKDFAISPHFPTNVTGKEQRTPRRNHHGQCVTLACHKNQHTYTRKYETTGT